MVHAAMWQNIRRNEAHTGDDMPRKHSSTLSPLHQTSFLEMPRSTAARLDPEGASQSEIVNVSQEHSFSLQYCTLPDGREMYAVRDWIAGITKSDNPVRFWNDLKKRMKKANVQIYASCVQLPYLATDGKRYKMDYADGQTLYGITQHMGVDTGIRNQVLSHLAKTGAFIDAARLDPEGAELAINAQSRRKAQYEGKDETWILVREMGKVTRKQLTAMILKVSPNVNLGIATNITYQNTLGANAAGLNAQLGQKPGSNPRDGMSRLALIYTMASEEGQRLRLESYGEDEELPPEMVYQILRAVSETVGMQARDMASKLGIDIITGRARLGSGDK
jgi:DNA-damage-inducible protein D